MDFLLRTWRIEDAPVMQRYADNPNIAVNLRNAFPCPYTLTDAQAYIQSCLENRDALLYTIDINGEAIGSIGLFPQRDVYEKSAELGYWLGEPFWGHGIMTQAIQQLCEEAFTTRGFCRIFAEPFADNLGSRRVLEKAGFSLEGILRKSVYKNGVFHDSCMYAYVT